MLIILLLPRIFHSIFFSLFSKIEFPRIIMLVGTTSKHSKRIVGGMEKDYSFVKISYRGTIEASDR